MCVARCPTDRYPAYLSGGVFIHECGYDENRIGEADKKQNNNNNNRNNCRDEGFHQLLISRFDPVLSLEVGGIYILNKNNYFYVCIHTWSS